MQNSSDWLEQFSDQKVAVDLDSGHLLIGHLLSFDLNHLLFIEADLHDCKNANSSKEIYLLEAGRYGINVNRRKVAVPRSRMLAISRLEDTVNDY